MEMLMKIPWEKGKASHSSILPQNSKGPWGCKELTHLSNFHAQYIKFIKQFEK